MGTSSGEKLRQYWIMLDNLGWRFDRFETNIDGLWMGLNDIKEPAISSLPSQWIVNSLSLEPGVDGHEDAREESKRESKNSRVEHSLVVKVDFEPTKESMYCRCAIWKLCLGIYSYMSRCTVIRTFFYYISNPPKKLCNDFFGVQRALYWSN